MAGSKVVPVGMNYTTNFGFVVNHHAYWGVPIPGFAMEPQPATTPPFKPKNVPSSLQVVSAKTMVDNWTGNDFSILATRMPPLFHALHHETIVDPQKFIRRKEPSEAGSDLPGKGRDACVFLFDQSFRNGTPEPIDIPPPIPLAAFDKKTLFKDSMKGGYFATTCGEWQVSKLGLLGALWIVILQADKQNTPLDGLEGGYRLWHHKAGHGNHTFYTWEIEQSDSFENLCFKIDIGRDPEGMAGPTGVATLKMDLKWI